MKSGSDPKWLRYLSGVREVTISKNLNFPLFPKLFCTGISKIKPHPGDVMFNNSNPEPEKPI